ncbi:MAG: flagellar basal body rod protein FlgB [Pseudomonadota bacterium]
MLNRLDNSLGFQSQALLLRAERQRLIASNIANADTPGYQARDIDFATALRQATGSATAPVVMVTGTSDRHLGLGQLPATREAGQLYALPSQTNLDGNTVDMDRERASFADNAVKYEASLRFINSSVRTMLDAIKGQ